MRVFIPAAGHPSWEGEAEELLEVKLRGRSSGQCSYCGFISAEAVDIKTSEPGRGHYNRCMDCMGPQLIAAGLVW